MSEIEYVTWECDCPKKNPKTGIAPHHVWAPLSSATTDYPPTPFGVIIVSKDPVAAEARRAPARRASAADRGEAALVADRPCPTWRTVTRVRTTPNYALPGPAGPAASRPAGSASRSRPVLEESIREIGTPEELGRSARALAPYATRARQARGRIGTSAGIITQELLSGPGWTALFSSGRYATGRLAGRPVGYRALLTALRTGGTA